MLLMEATLDSRTLHFPTSYTVALPDAALTGARCPAALWLHDLGANRGALPSRVALGPLVERHGTALILPDGRRSCFLNMARGPQWNDFLARELVPMLARTLPIAADAVGVIGAGTGALGALQLARRGFPVALIGPAVADVDGRDPARWPVEGEWRGVFEDGAAQWAPGLWAGATGALFGDAEAAAAAAARFGLEAWPRTRVEGGEGEALNAALAFIRGALPA